MSATLAHTDISGSPKRSRSALRTLAHAVGNVFLGIAIGLATYYVATDLLSEYRQNTLREELAVLGPIATVTAEDLGPATGVFEWDGWEQEDVAYWESLPEGGVFGRLVIERMGLDTVVVKGQSRAVLKRGPGWIDYTDLPGPTGNCGISGHRTTYGAPFRRLDELQPGDFVDLYSPYRRYRYQFEDLSVVAPNRIDVVESTPEPRLTLTACHPLYSAAQRLIASSLLVDVRRIDDGGAEE